MRKETDQNAAIDSKSPLSDELIKRHTHPDTNCNTLLTRNLQILATFLAMQLEYQKMAWGARVFSENSLEPSHMLRGCLFESAFHQPIKRLPTQRPKP